MTERLLIILVPTNAVGLIIGKAGQFLKYIGFVSGALLRLQPFEEMAHGIQERAVFITGDSSQIQMAVQVILMRLQVPLNTVTAVSVSSDGTPRPGGRGVGDLPGSTGTANDNSGVAGDPTPTPVAGGDASQCVLQWIIPKTACGLLIGKNGSRIKMINESSGAWVKVAHHEEVGPGIGECFIYIRGTAPQTIQALSMVKEIAGGRPYKTTESDSVHLLVPVRAVNELIDGDGTRNIPPVTEIFEHAGISVKVEMLFVTGISSAKLHITGGHKQTQHEALATISARLHEWKERQQLLQVEEYMVPALARAAGYGGGGGGGGGAFLVPDLGSGFGSAENGTAESKNAKEDMTLLFLVGNESAEAFLRGSSLSIDGSENPFSVITSQFHVTLDLVPTDALSTTFGQRTRVMGLTGPLGSLLHVLTPIHETFLQYGSVPAFSSTANVPPQVLGSSGQGTEVAGPRGGTGHTQKAVGERLGSGSAVFGSAGAISGTNGGQHRSATAIQHTHSGSRNLYGSGSGNGASGSSNIKRIDQLSGLITDMLKAIKGANPDTINEPYFRTFLQAFDDFKSAHAARTASSVTINNAVAATTAEGGSPAPASPQQTLTMTRAINALHPGYMVSSGLSTSSSQNDNPYSVDRSYAGERLMVEGQHQGAMGSLYGLSAFLSSPTNNPTVGSSGQTARATYGLPNNIFDDGNNGPNNSFRNGY